jgi:hypothetical protein
MRDRPDTTADLKREAKLYGATPDELSTRLAEHSAAHPPLDFSKWWTDKP